MKVYLVELREMFDPEDNTDQEWGCTIMFVGSTLEKAVEYCAANVDELVNKDYLISWYAICEHTIDLDDAVDGELLKVYGKYGPLEDQPVDGYVDGPEYPPETDQKAPVW